MKKPLSHREEMAVRRERQINLKASPCVDKSKYTVEQLRKISHQERNFFGENRR